MGKLSISVPDELEHKLRERAASEGTTVSALLAAAAERYFGHAAHLASAQELLDEAIAEHGPLTPEELARASATLAAIREFTAESWARAS